MRGNQLSIAFGSPRSPSRGLSVVGLFAGIGGLERGLHGAGHSAELFCEVDEAAQRVLRKRFPGVSIAADVRALKAIPRVDLVAAGFPCQDLSQAGRTAGIGGSRSSLVGEVFRLIGTSRPRWLLLENVPFMLQLERGEAMRYLTEELQQRGYRWAYRVVETRAFGLPQRRRRVILLASRTEDPRQVLFADDAGDPPSDHVYSDSNRAAPLNGSACGFYWTEGLRGLGWAVDATPTLKAGSTVGIPSPPAIVMPSGEIVTPDIRDAERLQGFPAGWTGPALTGTKKRVGPRWRLVGNAVSVPVARWVGAKLLAPGRYDDDEDSPYQSGAPWPNAAWSMGRDIYQARISVWPKRYKRKPLAGFLRFPTTPLSARATAGFRARTQKARLRFPAGFIEAIEAHLVKQQAAENDPDLR